MNIGRVLVCLFVLVGPATSVLACLGNVNGDQDVDVQDLVEVVLEWGQPGGPADLNGDGVVDVQDLLEVILHWGPCPEVGGACCFINGFCDEPLDEFDCVSIDGVWQGAGTTCEIANCPFAPGACCFLDQTCLEMPILDCEAMNGAWFGVGLTCEINPCPELGACCLPTGCIDGTFAESCVEQGGFWNGVGSECSNAKCK